MIEMRCGSCERRLGVPGEYAGCEGSCPSCGAGFVVPDLPDATGRGTDASGGVTRGSDAHQGPHAATAPGARSPSAAMRPRLTRRTRWALGGAGILVLSLGVFLALAGIPTWLWRPSFMSLEEEERRLPRLDSATTDAIRALTARGDLATARKALSHANPWVRAAAAEVIGNLGGKAQGAVPELADALRDDFSIVREEAARALGRIGAGAEPAVADLIDSLKYDYAHVRCVAAEALGRIGEAALKAAPVLAAALAQSNPQVGAGTDRERSIRMEEDARVAAAAALGALGPGAKDTVPQLSAALRDASPRVREAAAHALGQMGSAALSSATALLDLSKDRKLREVAAEALGRIGPAAIPSLIEGLKDEKTCPTAVRALGAIGAEAKDAGPALLALIDKADSETAEALEQALPAIGPSNIRGLLELIGRGPDPVRARALEIVRAFGKAAGPPLKDALQADSTSVQAWGAVLLVEVEPGCLDAIATLASALALEDEELTSAAAAALASFGKRSLPPMLLALEDPARRRHAFDALTKMGAEAAGSGGALVKAMQADPGAASQACGILKQLPQEAASAVPALVTLLQKDDARAPVIDLLESIGAGAVQALPRLVDLARDGRNPQADRAARRIAGALPRATARVAGDQLTKDGGGLLAKGELREALSAFEAALLLGDSVVAREGRERVLSGLAEARRQEEARLAQEKADAAARAALQTFRSRFEGAGLDPYKRVSAFDALRNCLAHPEVLAELGRVLANDGEPAQVRQEAAARLGASGVDAAIPLLDRACASTKDLAVQRAIIAAIGLIPTRNSVQTLEQVVATNLPRLGDARAEDLVTAGIAALRGSPIGTSCAKDALESMMRLYGQLMDLKPSQPERLRKQAAIERDMQGALGQLSGKSFATLADWKRWWANSAGGVEDAAEAPCRECRGQGFLPCRSCIKGKVQVDCPACHGSGSVSCSRCQGKGTQPCSCGTLASCPICRGSGRIDCDRCEDGKAVCGRCKGTREVQADCPTCKGRGRVPCATCKARGAIEDPDEDAAGTLLAQAKAFEANGESAKALERYRQVVEEHPATRAAKDAREWLAKWEVGK